MERIPRGFQPRRRCTEIGILPVTTMVPSAVGSRTKRFILGAVLIETVLIAEPGGPLDLLRSRLNSFQDGFDTVVLGVHCGLAFLAAFCVSRYGRRRLSGGVHRWLAPALALSMWAALSSVWSGDPLATIERAVMLLALVALGAAFRFWLCPADQLRTLALAWSARSFLSSFVSLVSALPTPMTVLARGSQGAHVQSNYFGAASGLGLLLCSAAAMRSTRNWERRGFLALGLLHLVLLWQADCATAVVATVTGLAVLGGLRFRRHRARRFGVSSADRWALVGFLAAASAAVALRPAVLSVLHREPDLSGRTTLWRYAGPTIRRRLLQGWGFNSLWERPGIERDRITRLWGANVLHIHNSFLEILLGTGLVGLALFCTALTAAAIQLWKDRDSGSADWKSALFVAVLVGMVTESLPVEPPHFAWAMLAALAIPRSLDPLDVVPDRQSVAGVEH